VEPIPETARAISEFGPFTIENDDLLVELLDKADQVRDVVPACVGISLASALDEATFTVVATAQEIALLDGVQYFAGGPCVAGVKAEQVLSYDHAALLEEEQWRLFAQATAAAAVASTLTLPILVEGSVVGSVNLYAAAPDAFDGHHEEIARIFDAWAPGAVTNADLSFSTRGTAEQTPGHLRADIDVTVASALIAADRGISIDTARQLLHEAAQRAGVTETQLAHTIVELQDLHDAE
jgi:GAF domain-containing protein